MATLAELIVRVGADATQFEKHMGKIERTLNKTSRTLTDVGGKLTTGLTIPLAAAGGGALKASIDFESAFAGVRKTVDATDEELAQMRKGILDMAGELPASATELSAIAEAAGQLGIETGAILGFTKTIVDLGVSTNLAGEEAATMLAQFANITQMPQDQFDRLGATLVALGNAGASTERDIMEMGLRIAGAGAQVGMTEAQILAMANALASVGIEAEAGGSAISRVMINIANEVASGGERLKGFAQVAGMSVEEFSTAWREDAASALASFIEGLKRVGDEGGNVFAVLDELGLSEIRVRDALLRAANAGDLFRSSLELGSQAWAENTALTNEAAQRYATTESRLAVLRNQLVNVGITLGDALAPALSAAITAAQPFIDTLRRMAEWFANLDPGMQQVIITIGLVAAAIGPLLLIIGKAISTVSGLVGAFKMLPGAFTAITGPVGIVVAAIAGLIAVVTYLWHTNDEFRAAVIATWEHIQAVAVQVFTALQEFWAEWGATIQAFFSGVWEQIRLTFETVINIIAGILQAVMALIRGDWKAAWEAVKGIGETVWAYITGSLQIFADTMANIWDTVKDKVLDVWESIKEGISNIWKGIVNSIIGFINKIINAVNGMIGGLNRISFTAPDWVPVIGGKSWGINIATIPNVPMLAEGGIITAPTLAMIGEAGPEAVVPLSKMGRYGGGGNTVVINWTSLARPSDSEVRQVARLIDAELYRMKVARA
ncbi:phage tail tape measure protein [Symbiobacterium terraclitae]|uniref:phage tail tape measure protein n=1 Tax=Symbiobacterium terraclitae TaxID=557451 RepID=UPI0035B55299